MIINMGLIIKLVKVKARSRFMVKETVYRSLGVYEIVKTNFKISTDVCCDLESEKIPSYKH